MQHDFFLQKSAPIGFIYRSQLHIICGAAKEQLFQLCQHANSISTSTVRGPGILRLPLFCRASLARRCNRFFFAPRAHETRGILVRLLRLHQRCFSSNRTRRTVTAPSQVGTWTTVEEKAIGTLSDPVLFAWSTPIDPLLPQFVLLLLPPPLLVVVIILFIV